VEPARFNNKAAEVAGKSMEAIEINKHILHVRGELIRHYNLLKAQGPTVTPTMLKNAYQGVGIEKKTLIGNNLRLRKRTLYIAKPVRLTSAQNAVNL
jgi:uncharacterized protein YvpB